MAIKSMLIDLSKCTGCRACQVACKAWNDNPGEETLCWGYYTNPPDLSPITWNRVAFYEFDVDNKFTNNIGWVLRPVRCMHCIDAPCVKVCPTGALYKHEMGFTAYNEAVCNGCGYCTQFCPFNIPRLTATDWTGQAKASKCTFCQDRAAAGLVPACAKTCAPGAIQYGDREAMIQKGNDRVGQLQGNGFSEASLYNPASVGGTIMMYVLPYSLDKMNQADATYGGGVAPLPANPSGGLAGVWQNVLQPVGGWAIGLGALGLAVNWLYARRKIRLEEE